MPALAEETGDQDQRFAAAFRLIEEAIAAHAFPGAALAVAFQGRVIACRAFGRFTYGATSPEPTRETLWDLASLTKPIATASMAMLLYERGQLSLEEPVANYLPEFAPDDDPQLAWRRQVTAAMLLAHSSGLPAHRKLYLQATGKSSMRVAARAVGLEAEPGSRAVYSDLGFIILGEVLERVADETLDKFCRREVFSPLKLNMTYYPQPSLWNAIPPTADATEYRHRRVQGEVNDDNAAAMGGVAAHAGLFADPLSVARFAECLLSGGAPLFQRETVELFTRRQTSPADTPRTLGWDTPSTPSQSGTLFSPRSFGHLGYTGTSLWCDPERHLSVTLLTNRTWPNADSQGIQQLRPALHDAILSRL